ncbi:2-dehydropantoate 2-reductase [Evansella sp. AB-P1]|uniref:2-dehydropantoate 2-reductase n=1 Tax=Evansella sp. AB-P1 TaxID=3037653 RepID=UPI00241CC588|nr:2-dehydropantoate 2-reductase [Evansella sp. AB-P1]MDG5788300.1 2-dehydropantoate 2-reductase [Evansella sp. AB-P1]
MIKIKIAIIGSGAIGLLLAHFLVRSGHEVTVVTRTEKQRNSLYNEGLFLLQHNDEYLKVNVDVKVFTEDFSHVDLFIVALKQTTLSSFFERLKSFKKVPPVVFLQNGMGHLEKAQMYCSSPIIGGVVTHGAKKLNDYSVQHTGFGTIEVGNWKCSSMMLSSLVSYDPHFPIYEVDNIEWLMKRKLLMNLVINPLTAIYRVKNGELLSNQFFFRNAKDIFKEGIAVLKLPESEWENVIQVIKNTSENQSSMYLDIVNRRKTEITSISGYVIEKANKEGVHVPLTKFIHQSIVGLEKENEK